MNKSLLTLFFCVTLVHVGFSSITTEEYKDNYLQVVNERDEAIRLRDYSRKELTDYVADNTWRLKRDSELRQYLYSGECWKALKKQLDERCQVLFANKEVLKRLDISYEQLMTVYKNVDARLVLGLKDEEIAEAHAFDDACKAIGLPLDFLTFGIKYNVCAMVAKDRGAETKQPPLNELIGKLHEEYANQKENSKNSIKKEKKKISLYTSPGIKSQSG